MVQTSALALRTVLTIFCRAMLCISAACRAVSVRHSLVRAVVKAPKSSHVTPILRSLHWLKVNERIEYKLLSLAYKVLTTSQPSYLNNLISVQPPRSTRSSLVVTLSRPPTISSLKITVRSFRYASPRLWNQLPDSFRQPLSLASHVSTHLFIHLSAHLYYHHHSHHPSLIHSFTPGPKPTFSTNPSHLRFLRPDCLHDNGTGPDLSCSSFYF